MLVVSSAVPIASVVFFPPSGFIFPVSVRIFPAACVGLPHFFVSIMYTETVLSHPEAALFRSEAELVAFLSPTLSGRHYPLNCPKTGSFSCEVSVFLIYLTHQNKAT